MLMMPQTTLTLTRTVMMRHPPLPPATGRHRYSTVVVILSVLIAVATGGLPCAPA